ncbi:maleylacetate reductase [Mesorhizobium sp.]|uniref:maleylacetate reductase n=1 Tax=Mesorhizobium sp. TaxID=1871066 RepID=UPI000FE878A3|nr:maleylacetate reductase [Mesorhizobium sp.]RWO78145.1 MAG: maleylacetate reductase [Mesorhizobium sp.]RWQ46417.1 MAG: maleylacetate reductase [Mesorhizobium sp.]
MARLPESFVYSANASRVVFGAGSVGKVGEEVDRLGLQRVLVLSTPQQEDFALTVASRLAAKSVGVFAGAAMHTPVNVTEQAMRYIQEKDVDGLIAIGGGSTTGLSKALALRTDLPQIAIPTTYAGSEMTPILGETAKGQKKTITSPKVLPEVVIYDVDLTLSLPVALSGTSGINAIAHAVEALYAQDRNPIIDLMAGEAIGALAKALPTIRLDPGDKEARSLALYGAWLAGTCLGAVGMSLHHKLCHTLGGTFDLPHAETHTIMLPHALAYNAPAVPDAIDRLKRVLETDDPSLALYELAGQVGAARALKDIGMPENGLVQARALALSNPYWNPRQLDENRIGRLLHRAYAGMPPLVE